jgi:DNA end-binding protein Ku
MASRPAWEGHLKLSLVTCPVSLYPATGRGKTVRFNMINPDTGNRIRTEAQDQATGERVERTETLKGFEVDKGLYVTLTDEEIRAAKLPDTGSLQIERFVPVKEIDRLYWASPYYLVPNGDVAAEPFSVIREAMRAEGKVALARYVKGGKERQLALEPRGRGIVAHELRPRDQVHAEADFFGRIPDIKVDKGMVALAKQILQQHEGPFDPSTFKDRYTEGLLALIEEKRKSQGVTRSRGGDRGPSEAEVVNLMEALKRSLAAASAPAAPSLPRRPRGGKVTPLPTAPARATKAASNG